MILHKHKPLGFRKWIDLENHKKSISEAVEGNEFPDRVFDYLSAAFGDRGWEKKPYKTPVESLVKGFQTFNPDNSLPILHAPKSDRESDAEYKGRTWNYFSHLLASAYGWTLEYIAGLDVNEALGHIQEVLTKEYLDQEFQHSLSEVAYVYNKSTKKSDYKPLPKPYWMRPIAKPIKRFRIKRSLLPVGYVIDSSGMAEQLGLSSIVTKPDKPDNLDKKNEIIPEETIDSINSPTNTPSISPPA